MSNIIVRFKEILVKQKELNYHFPNILRKPASLQDIGKTEHALDLTFNDELKELYLFADGTDIDSVTPSNFSGPQFWDV